MARKNKPFAALLVFNLFITPTASAEIENLPILGDFVQKMEAKHHFERAKLMALFKSARLKKDILKVIAKPAEAYTPWYRYQKLFVTKQRIAAGLKFWQENEAVLTTVEQKYGVPVQIIVAIIGIETFYGQDNGRYRVIDALATLGFFYPKRSDFFLSELENFLLMCREEKLNPLTPVGSYAGAMGIAQFMPSSFRSYAVDYDHDKKRDIWHNRADAIASVANYLAHYGWKKQQAVTYPVTATGESYQQALTPDLAPDLTLAQLQALKINLPNKLDLNLKAKLLSFEQEQGSSLWLGLTNFYVITRYNHSALYAMAVYQLSAAILAKKGLLHEH